MRPNPRCELPQPITDKRGDHDEKRQCKAETKSVAARPAIVMRAHTAMPTIAPTKKSAICRRVPMICNTKYARLKYGNDALAISASCVIQNGDDHATEQREQKERHRQRKK